MTTFTEGRHAAEFVLAEANGNRSRGQATIIASTAILAGQVLGKLTSDGAWDAASAAKAGGNTGDGTLALATPKTAASRAAGVYQVRKKGDTFSVGAPAFVGTGNGVLTPATPAFGAGVKLGTYKAIVIEPGANVGTFQVEDPDGIVIGIATVGVAFDGVVKFTIADGATDFVAGDTFSLAVTAAVTANGGAFSVTTPAGVALADATVGVAYTTQVNFTIADGATDFIVGDGFDVTVTQAGASGEFDVIDFAGALGENAAAAIALYPLLAADTDRKIAIIERDCTVNGNCLEWPVGATTDQKNAAIAQIKALGIIVR